MKYRIVSKKVWDRGRYELRYFPQAYVRRWYWPWMFWANISWKDDGWRHIENAQHICEEHSKIGVIKEFEL